MKPLIDFSDYRELLRELLDHHPSSTRGVQTRLAKHISCQQAFISRVLAGLGDLGPEQAFGVADYFSLSELEREYWLALVAENRAGTPALREYHQARLRKIKQQFASINQRIEHNPQLEEHLKVQYYSHWSNVAIHIFISVADYANEDTICKRLGLSRALVDKSLKLLQQANLIKYEGGRWSLSNGRLHLPPDHPLVAKHHTNWRLFTLQRLNDAKEGDIHYTSVVSCSRADQTRVQTILAEAVSKIRSIIKDSKDEVVCHYAVDFLEL